MGEGTKIISFPSHYMRGIKVFSSPLPLREGVRGRVIKNSPTLTLFEVEKSGKIQGRIL